MNIVGVLSGKRKCLLAIAIAFSTFGNAQLVTYPEGLNTGMPHNDDYTVKVREAGGSGEWSCYEGSYVEVGGKRISDVKQIMPCIIETLEEAERVEKLAQERVEEICRSEKEIEEKELLVSE